jgi:NTP pyrophosphatase (non-canonical NTP hydrolase)
MAPVLRLSQPLSFPEYALKSGETNRFQNFADELDNLRFGYFGEIGGLLSAVKKSVRDHQLKEEQTQLVSEELGDALWYLFATARALEIKPDDLGYECMRALRGRFGENEIQPVLPINFRQIDGILNTHREIAELDRSKQLGMLASAAGVLANMTPAQLRALSLLPASEHFGRLLVEWALTCSSFSLAVEDVARSNLEKIASRWPGDNKVFESFFDPDPVYPAHEQFPRKFEIEFIERGTPESGMVVQVLSGVFIGDRLTDNIHEADDYRFHDVFHLAYVAYLGWSPVLRGLLKRKRKSKPKIDENEDGARAAIMEEGIATWIFNHAKRRNFYADVKEGTLEYGLLKQIQSMVEGYEVERCKLWQWELAILKGFEMFRFLKTHRGGTIAVDMIEHTLSFLPPQQKAT